MTRTQNESWLWHRLGWLTGAASHPITQGEGVLVDLQGRLQAMIEAAREAGAETGTWNLPDQFVDGIEARLRGLVRSAPESIEVDAEVLQAEIVSVSKELREQEEALTTSVGATSAWITLSSAGMFGLAGLSLAVFLLLSFLALPVGTSLLICSVVLAGGIAMIQIAARWADWRQRRLIGNRIRQLRKELASLEAESRRAARSQAQLDAWVAQSRQIVEAEYLRFRTLAAQAASLDTRSIKPDGGSQPSPHRVNLALTSIVNAAAR